MILHSAETIEKFQKLGVWGRGTMLDKLAEAAATCPEQLAFVDPPNRKDLTGHAPERITYKRLNEISDAVASALVEQGIEKDDVVVVQLPNCWELGMLYYAIAKAGAIISPIPVQWRRNELEYVLDLTGAKAFVTIEEFNGFSHLQMGEEAKSGANNLDRILSLDEIRDNSKRTVPDGALDGIQVLPADIWTLQWSSGTEAKSKACPRTHDNWYNIYAADILLQLEEHWAHLIPAQIVNNTGITYGIVLPLINKGKSVLHHPFHFEVWLQQVKDEEVDLAGLVPAMMNMVLKHPKSGEFNFDTLKRIGTGSAPPSRWAMEEFKKRYGVNVINIWGQNEGPTIHSGPLTTPMEKRMQFPQFGKKGVDWGIESPYLRAIETKLLDPAGNEVTGLGEVGELVWKGPEVMPCYFNAPELTEKAFDADGYIYTGDLFQIEPENFISFYDRKKDIIIRGGQNISAQEIENLILKHPNVQEAAVVPMPDPVMGEKTCAYIVAIPDAEVRLEDVKALFQQEGVAKYKWPERLEGIDMLPRNHLGKILKANLRQDINAKIEKEGSDG
jgi:non-ribosomal peptide synthetase component E (peptide arylation enzyme)